MEPALVNCDSARIRVRDEGSIPAYAKCSSCSNLLINGFQTPHGCRLCQQCVTEKLRLDERQLCPCINSIELLDRNRGESGMKNYFVSEADCLADTATRRDVLKIEVRCPNEESGCQAELNLKQLDSHLACKCEFEFATCEHCSEQVPQFELNGRHRDLQSADCCASFRAPCPLCETPQSGNFNRREFVEHLKACSERPSNCKYRESVGCQIRRRMSKLCEHYDSAADSHLELTVQRFQQKMSNMDAELSNLKKLVKDLQATCEWKDSEIKSLLHQLLEPQTTSEVKIKALTQLLKKLLLPKRIRQLSNSLNDYPADKENDIQESVRVSESTNPRNIPRRGSMF